MLRQLFRRVNGHLREVRGNDGRHQAALRSPAADERALWIGCGTKTVAEVAMVAGKFPVPIWSDTDMYESFPGSGVKIALKDAIPPIGTRTN